MATPAPETHDRITTVCLGKPSCLRPGSRVLVQTDEGRVSIHVRETGQRFGANEAFFTAVGVVLTLREWRELGERRDELTECVNEYNRYGDQCLPNYLDIELNADTSASVHVFESLCARVRLFKFIRTTPENTCQKIALHIYDWWALMRSWDHIQKLIEEASN